MYAEVELKSQILSAVSAEGNVTSLKFATAVQESHQKIIGIIKSLESMGDIVNVHQSNVKSWVCTEEGASVAQSGSHEARLFSLLPLEGRSMKELKESLPFAEVAVGAALKNKWVKIEHGNVVPNVASVTDKVQIDLQSVRDGQAHLVDTKQKADYKKRKLIKDVDVTVFEVSKGKDFTTSLTKKETELTKELIESGQWKLKAFKPFNFKAKGKIEHRSGYLHPLMQMRAEFRQIFLELGFTEMPTNNFVESSFWNYDALFQAQHHPARSSQDTFFIADPSSTLSIPRDYMEKVKNVHSHGGYGSIGYQCPWSTAEAEKNVLRTHTTAVSARMLYKLAQEGFRPVKYFSIDRVFRNETLDATHLAEFHQIEGIVADYNLSLKHLMGVIAAFFEKIGISKLRFKPAYNPYTEPSMEIFSFHEGLKKWVEIGNSGIFRPEMLRPMGLPEAATVIAWGLSLERPTMIMHNINNIRELVGPKVKLELILNNPMCTLDKHSKGPEISAEKLLNRQDEIIQKLNCLQERITKLSSCFSFPLPPLNAQGIPLDVVVYACYDKPPYSLKVLLDLFSNYYKTCGTVHVHSDAREVPEKLLNFWSASRMQTERKNCDLSITLIWKSTHSLVTSMNVSPVAHSEIYGEHNICRYLARLMESKVPSIGIYESTHDANKISMIDEILDETHLYMQCASSHLLRASFVKKVERSLQRHSYLVCDTPTLADILLASCLKQLQGFSISGRLEKWMKDYSQHSLVDSLPQ